MAKVAWLGTGLLGAGFVEAMCGRGDEVVVWNRTIEKARALEAKGARVAASPAEAVKGVERVHLCLSDDAAVDAVLAAMGPIDPAIPLLDHTTVSPKGARERSARLRAEGRTFLGCPVFMGPSNARRAQGSMLVAGPKAAVERYAPALSQMTGRLFVYGEDLGIPAALKLFGNSFILGITGLLSDAMSVAGEGGASPEQALEILESLDPNGSMKARLARLYQPERPASFELSMARKDVRLMIEAAGDRPLAALPSLAARMDTMIAAGQGHRDSSAIVERARETKAT